MPDPHANASEDYADYLAHKPASSGAVMTERDETHPLLKGLEPGVADINSPYERLIEASKARSLKRIADILEQIEMSLRGLHRP